MQDFSKISSKAHTLLTRHKYCQDATLLVIKWDFRKTSKFVCLLRNILHTSPVARYSEPEIRKHTIVAQGCLG